MTARGVFARRRRAAGLCVATLGLMGCYFMRPSSGGGQTKLPATRSVRDADVLLPDGFRIEAVATGLTFPTGVVEDGQGRPHVVESGYCYGEVWTTPRLLRIEAGGEPVPVASGGRNGPWNGVAFHEGAFFVAEGGVLEGGRILRITPEGRTTTLVSGLPSQGDHHTNGPAIGPDGRVYFGQGTATNSAVVGTDNASFGWLARNPRFHDVPCQDVILAGRNFRTDDPLPTGRGRVSTGAFSPLGVETRPGQRIEGRVPCSGAVLRVPPDGGEVELVAWGFRNPFARWPALPDRQRL
jgi:hypothetical protein